MTLKEMLAAYAALEREAAAIKALPDDEITEAHVGRGVALPGELTALKAKIDAVQAARNGAGEASAAAKSFLATPVHPAGGPAAAVKAQPAGDGVGTSHSGDAIDLVESEDDKYLRGGPFKSLGHFAHAIQHGGGPMPGLVNHGLLGEWNGRVTKVDHAVKAMARDVKAVSGMSELIDSDGAAFVPLDISTAVWERTMQQEENLLALVDQTPVSGSGYRLPAWNDKSRTGGLLYGGARAYWGNEGGQSTGSKPATRMIDFRLNKITVLMYVTEELLEDTVALDARLARVAAANFAYEINKAIVAGDGVGKPLGITAAACKITVAAETGQGAGTIVGKNVTKMYARRAPGVSRRMVWLYNVDCEPQLDQLNFTAGSTAAQWLYTTSLRDDATPMLKGRRMIECEHCPTVGTEGDLVLWDPGSYGAIVKTTGVKQAVSMHLRFDYGEAAFRWAFRMDGKPFWDDVLTPANGNTRAPIVTLNGSRS